MTSAWTPLFLALLAGLSGGLLSGLFGVGGGIVLVPLLGLLLGVGQRVAQGLSLAVLLLPNGLPAVLHYRKAGIAIRWGIVVRLMVGFLGGVWLGAFGANRVPERGLRYTFIAVLLLLALRSFRGAGKAGATGEFEARNLNLALLIGLLGGLASGLLGIGGAVLMIPLMGLWLGLSQHEAQLASLVMMLPPIGLPAVLEYARNGEGLPWRLLAAVALGFLGGTALGARVATRLSGTRLKQIFGGVLVLMALLLAFRG